MDVDGSTLAERLRYAADKLDGYNFATKLVPLLRDAATEIETLRARVETRTEPDSKGQHP